MGVLLLLIVLSGMADSAPPNPAPSDSDAVELPWLDELEVDFAPIFRHLPNVAEVTRHGPTERPTHRIVHLLDWHFVDRETFAADLRSLSDKPIADAEIDRRHAKHLTNVAQVQAQQMALLRWLIKHHGLERVHVEGLFKRDRVHL